MKDSVEIYVLTHKEFNEDYDSNLYKPLLCGSALINDDFGYFRDDSGENISQLNSYYAELTGEYWAWKNSNADIIGFCHYRRWFIRNLKFNKLTKKDILSSLDEYDIILPQKSRFQIPVYRIIQKGQEINPNYGVKYEDYLLLGNIIENYFTDYYDDFKKVMNGKYCFNNNMFISHKEIANKYFEWIFQVFNKLFHEIDFSKYPENNKRVFGFMSELLLTVFVVKNKLSIKEYYLYHTGRKIPFLQFLSRRFPLIGTIENRLANWK